MAFLNSNELKRLKKTPIDARVVYIFSARLRMKLGNTTIYPGETEEDGYEVIRDDVSDLMTTWDPPVLNEPAIKQRLQAMKDVGTITSADIRKITAVLGMRM